MMREYETITLYCYDKKNRKWLVTGFDKKTHDYGYYLPPEWEFVVETLEIRFDGSHKALEITDPKLAQSIMDRHGIDVGDMDRD